MSESEINTDKSSPNDTATSVESDVRERLTLHVRKRLSGELQVVVKQEKLSPTTSNNSTDDSPVRKKSKKCKKNKNKSCNNNNNNKVQGKKLKIKAEETSPVDHLVIDESVNNVETPDGSDEATSRHQSPAADIDEAAAQAARESFLNNAILSEILNEKKKALFESEEILELLRTKMKAIT